MHELRVARKNDPAFGISLVLKSASYRGTATIAVMMAAAAINIIAITIALIFGSVAVGTESSDGSISCGSRADLRADSLESSQSLTTRYFKPPVSP